MRLCLRSDNVGALSIFSSLKGSGVAINQIAREFALDAGKGAFEPDVIAHIPGVANDVADKLSRRLDPKYSVSWKTPEFLRHAQRVEPPARPLGWWRARLSPDTS